MDNGRSATYTYDPLFRLSTAVTTGSTNYAKWGLSWSYDRYGNSQNQTQTAGSPPSYNVIVSPSTNQITGSPYLYDLSGNMTNDGQNSSISYDAENHVVSSLGSLGSGTYTYDGNGNRVQKTSGSTTTVYIFSGSKVIAEYDNGAAVGSPSREYIYGGGALLAKIDSTGTKYYHQDHLSNRMVTDSSGNVYAQMGHYPFGERWYNTTNDKLFFTTYERDAESGNDYAMARTYINRLGRFSSPDPLSGDTSDPQSLNRYTYVRNVPVGAMDPSGMDEVKLCGDNEDDDGPTCDEGGGVGDWGNDSGQDPGAPPDIGLPGYQPGDPSILIGDQQGPQPPLPPPDVTSVTVTATADSFDQVDWINPSLNPNANSLFGPAATMAIRLIMKPDCLNFLIGVQRGAIAVESGGNPGNYERNLATKFNPVTNQFNMNAVPVTNMNNLNPTTNGFTTIAEITGSSLAGDAQVTMYQGFFSGGTLTRAQVLVHESMHLYARASDQQLAAAAGVRNALGMSTPQASSEFNKKLLEHCK
jgi:RHS repeat-associated protein